MSLNPKQRRFVAEYLKDQNAKQAAIRAGYSKRSAEQIGSRLMLSNVEVKAAVNAGLEKVEKRALVTVEYVVNGFKEVAERCLQRAPVMVRDGREMVQKVDEDGNHVWDFDSAGANKALESLGRYLKMFTDKVEHGLSRSLEDILTGSREATK